jgi:hypothetical protein
MLVIKALIDFFLEKQIKLDKTSIVFAFFSTIYTILASLTFLKYCWACAV